ncbi:M14 family zinc carboxypeptidase [Lactonifactor longoviformis]|uniref:M14 family zinc carboxypeptidase n=1 Tax=Lactonifactor longoviformis TaxID=341220 RepID=UPI0036F35563
MISLDKHYTYDELYDAMELLAAAYSDFLIFRNIGLSHDNRPIPMIRLGLGEQVLICTAGIHGRECVNPAVLVRMIEEYSEAYEKRTLLYDIYDVHKLCNTYSICFVPLVNPDGYETALQGFSGIRHPVLRHSMRMKEIDWSVWKYNARCVDINRNFPCKSYVQQQPEDYPGSENETKALIELFHSYETVAYLDFHSRGRLIYYYRNAMPFLYNQKSFRLARQLQKICHYALGKKEEEFLSVISGGNSVNYYSETFQKPAITIETVPDEASFPLSADYQAETYAEIRSVPLAVLKMS